MSVISYIFSFLHLFLLVNVTFAQNGPTSWSAVPFNAPSLPLAVKSPFLSAWNPQGNSPAENGKAWPRLWNVNNVLGWSATIRVDGHTYSLLGDTIDPAIDAATQQSVQFTATQTIFNYQAGEVAVTLSFLSPVTPSDPVRQSIPFSYLSLNVSSIDGQSHDIQVYSDISAEWISGNNQMNATWTHTVDNNDNSIILQTSLLNPMPFGVVGLEAVDSTAYYTALNGKGVTWQISADRLARELFNSTGALNNTQDNGFREISENFVVFAISSDLGSIQSTTSPVVWAVGLVRDPVVQYNNQFGIESRSSYWWSEFPSVQSMIEFFLGDFDNAVKAATALDAKVQSDASAFSSNYADLAALSLRQTVGTTDITIKRNSDNSWNTSDVKIFMSNIGGVGGGGVNSVDVLYAAFPTFLYLNVTWAQALLTPLLEYQDGNSLLSFAAQDLGTSYPNATNPNSPTALSIEETGNMLIMTLASSQIANDISLINQHYVLLKKWGDFLVSNALNPGSQTTADGLSGSNQTNLALKGIIGIGAMAKISAAAGNTDDQNHYQNTAKNYISQWANLSTSSDGTHLLSQFNSQSTFGYLYNLYADKLLQLNLVPSNIYTLQASYYASQIPSNKFGILFDNSNSVARLDWTMLAAAAVPDSPTQNKMVDQIHTYVASSQDNHPLDPQFNPITGTGNGATGNSPASGAIFSFLAANLTVHPLTGSSPSGTSPGPSSPDNKPTNAGAIAGAVIGSIVGIGGLMALVIFLRRRRRYNLEDGRRPDEIMSSKPNLISPLQTTPYQYAVFPSEEPTGEPEPWQPPPPARHSLGSATASEPEAVNGPRPPSGSLSELFNPYSRDGSSVTRAPTEPLRSPDFSTDIGPSASQIGSNTTTSRTQSSTTNTVSAALIAKQTLVNEQLRTEVADLRLEMERIREERSRLGLAPLEEAPPSYTPPNLANATA